MQELRVVGTEDGALIATAENGDRYRLVVDEVLETQLRRLKSAGMSVIPKLRPRDIQAQIRAGLSAAEVAELADVDVEYIERFEGPILAEREHMVAAAHSVTVVENTEGLDEDAPVTFGAAIRVRLEALSATSERWVSWKDAEEGWLVKLTFTASGIDHDARWKFEPRRHILTPANSEAITLSKTGAAADTLIPRLRAVDEAPPVEELAATVAIDPIPETDPAQTVALPSFSSAAASSAAINRDDNSSSEGAQHTADLLQALRKRRGEREQRAEREARLEQDRRAPFDFDEATGVTSEQPTTPVEASSATPTLTGVDQDEDEIVPASEPEARSAASHVSLPTIGSFTMTPQPTPEAHTDTEDQGNAPISMRARRGRKSMPSWDEIVFGARTDED